MDLDSSCTEERLQIYDLLRRTFTTVVDDDTAALRELRSQARYWVDGDPDGVLSALESYLKQTLRTAITAATAESFLRSRGFHLRDLARDTRILPAIRQLQEKFEESVQPFLVGGALLPREEAGQLFDWLTTEGGPTFIALHGPAGVGKSGVLLALTRRLQQQGILYLPLRLDRQRPYGIARQFGHSLGLPESPAFCLKAVAGEGIGVLILDQLDALRWTGSQAAEALETCRELVREAIQSPNLKVVACCRSFDLENDPQISGWIERQHARKLPVDRLSEGLVKKVVAGIGVDPERMNPRQIDLLRTPHHLRAWEQTVKVIGEVVDFATERELLDVFWRSRLLEAERMGVPAKVVQEAVDGVVSYMDKNGTLVAPRRLLLGYGLVENVLFSLQVLTATDDNVTFSHQGYLDHQLAHLLLRRIDEGKTTVEEWLTAGYQGLFRREQLRLVLGLLREERHDRYLTTLQSILSASEVRFHLKQAALQFLGQVDDPRPAEIELVSSLFEEEQWQEHVIADVHYAHPPWIDSAQGIRFLTDWLEGEEWRRDQALRLIQSVIRERGQLCARLLIPYVDRGDDWLRRVAGVLPSALAKDSSELFALRVRLAEMGVGFSYLDWKGLRPDRFVPLLIAVLFSLREEEAPSRRSSGLLHGLEEIDLSEVSLEALVGAWTTLLPAAAEVLVLADVPEIEFSLRDPSRDWKSPVRELLRRLVSELVSRDFLGAIDLVERGITPLGEMLLLEALSRLDNTLVADRALEWLMSAPQVRIMLRKWIGVLILVLASCKANSNTQPDASPAAVPVPRPTAEAVAKAIPPEAATVKQVYQGKVGAPVVVIEENHGSKTGQLETALVLSQLHDRFALKHVILEGFLKGDESFDSTRIQSMADLSPLDRARSAARLVGEGEIGGAEFAAIVFDDILVHPAETAEEYSAEQRIDGPFIITMYLGQIALYSLDQEAASKAQAFAEEIARKKPRVRIQKSRSF